MYILTRKVVYSNTYELPSSIVNINRMSAGIALGVLNFNEMLEKCILFTLSQAWQLGRAVMRARVQHTDVIQAVVEQQKGIVLMTGKVCEKAI